MHAMILSSFQQLLSMYFLDAPSMQFHLFLS